MEQVKFTFSLLGKSLKKQTKTIEDQEKKQIKGIEDHGKLVEPNELIAKNFNIDSDRIPNEEQRKIFNGLIVERSSEFHNLEKRTNPYNFIYNYKTEGRSPKDFSV